MGWDGAPRGSVELEERGQERLTGFDITVATKIRSWRRLVALSLNLSLSLSQDTGQVGGSNWAGICVCVCGGGGQLRSWLGWPPCLRSDQWLGRMVVGRRLLFLGVWTMDAVPV